MKEKKIARDTRNREKLAGDDWVMAEFYATWCPHCQRRNLRRFQSGIQ